jgi:hypothetical protein
VNVKKADQYADEDPDVKSEYDFASMSGGVRGKYAERVRQGSNVVLLEDDVAAAFPDSKSVNEALRAILKAAATIRH